MIQPTEDKQTLIYATGDKLMDCEKVTGWDTRKCCISCHEDSNEWGFDGVSIMVEDKEMEVCCFCAFWWEEKRASELQP